MADKVKPYIVGGIVEKPSEDNGFELLTGRYAQPRATLCIHGRTKSGKTWLGLSGPGDVGVLSNDPNTKAVAEKYAALHPEKRIQYKGFHRSPLSQIDDINDLKRIWGSQREAYYRMIESKAIRTILWDTHTWQWEDCKLAYVGREKPDLSSEVDPKTGKPTGTRFGTQKTLPRDLGDAKREIREMVNAAEGKNLVLLLHAEDEWKDDPTGKGFKTGRIVGKGMPGVGYLSQCEIELFREEKTGTFVARMLASTANSDIRGRQGALTFSGGRDVWTPSEDELVDDEINFQMIGIKVFPQTEYEDWE